MTMSLQEKTNEPTAKEMFEALGYAKYTIKQNNLIIGWQKPPVKDTDISRRFSYEYRNIQFYTNKTWDIFADHVTQALVFNRPTIEEHLAIGQQMKELGWIK